jgi:nucleoside-triphosphatase THEP1
VAVLLQVQALKARPDVVVISVSRDNRDQLVASISSQLQHALQQLPGPGRLSGS